MFLWKARRQPLPEEAVPPHAVGGMLENLISAQNLQAVEHSKCGFFVYFVLFCFWQWMGFSFARLTCVERLVDSMQVGCRCLCCDMPSVHSQHFL